MRLKHYFISLLLFAFLIPGTVTAQFSSDDYKPVKLSAKLIKDHQIKSVMAMFQVNTEGIEEGEDYLPRRESWEAYERYKDHELRKILFFTSLGSFVAYDTAGNVLSVVTMGKKTYTTYAYNRQNKMIGQKEIELNYPTSSDSEMEITYKYDDKGNLMGYNTGGHDVTFSRNSKGDVTSWKVIETEYTDPDEPKDPKTKPKTTDLSGQYKYDKQGRLLRQQRHPDYYDVTEYAENPKRITSLSYVKEQLKEKHVQEFDGQDRVVKREFYKLREGKLALYSTTATTYDKDGNILTQTMTNALEPALNQQV
ncbi:MAG TPA: hypothetical protein VK927_08995, partial [Adhaeribacter sp.]|nr:hypothetical protein [Adhaeribacter sp.]